MLALRRIWHLEIWLLIVMAATLVFSITRHTEHAPHWSLWIGAGLLAFFMCAQPKLTGAVIIAIPALMIALAHGFDLVACSPVLFAGELAGELLAWIHDPSRAGIRLAWTFSSLVVFLIVYLQLLLVARGKNIAPLLLLGIVIFTYLWHNRYADVEASMFIFFTLAFPAASLFHIRTRSKLDRTWYKVGILCLGFISALVVSIAPWDPGRLEVPEGLRLLSDPHIQETGLPGDTGTWSGLPEAGRMSGYSPGSELGGSVAESRETVMRLDLVEGTFPSSLYLRGRASDYYTGSSWEKRAAEQSENLEEAFTYMQSYETDLAVRVDYLKTETDLFGLFPTMDLKSSENEDQALDYRIDSFGNLEAPAADFTGEYLLSGKVISRIDLNRKEPRPELEKDSEELAPFMQVPEDLPGRVIELAAELTEGAGSEKARAEKIEDYLRQYPYTRETKPLPKGQDFVDHFIFELGEGYCSYYASAMVIMLRLNNIPARYVEGYRVSDHYEEHHLQIHPEDPDLGRSVRTIYVRSNSAHAWVEAFLQGYGWVAYEPTARYGLPLVTDPAEDRDTLREEEEQAAAATEDQKPPYGTGFFFAAASLLGLLAALSFSQVYFFYSRSKTPADLYARVIKVRTAFSGPPRPVETPGVIVEQLKKELPALAGEFEQMKKLYHLQRYAGNQGKAGKVQPELTSLPLRAAAVYRSKMGVMEYARGLLQLFLLALFPGRHPDPARSLNPAKLAAIFLLRQDSKPGPLK